VNNPFSRPSELASQGSHAAHDKTDSPLCLTQLAGRSVPSDQPSDQQPPNGSYNPPDIKDYPLVREFKTKLEGLYQLSGANLEDELKAYHANLPPGTLKAIEKERRQFKEAKDAYDQRMIDLGLNQTPNQQPQLGKPIFLQEPKPGKLLVQNELEETQIEMHNEIAFEAQAARLRALMGPDFEREAQKYAEKFPAARQETADEPDPSGKDI
jgi:hypothetical protein